jgi:hypothetical protein
VVDSVFDGGPMSFILWLTSCVFLSWFRTRSSCVVRRSFVCDRHQVHVDGPVTLLGQYEIEYLVPVEGGLRRIWMIEFGGTRLEWAPLSDGPVVLRLAT